MCDRLDVFDKIKSYFKQTIAWIIWWLRMRKLKKLLSYRRRAGFGGQVISRVATYLEAEIMLRENWEKAKDQLGLGWPWKSLKTENLSHHAANLPPAPRPAPSITTTSTSAWKSILLSNTNNTNININKNMNKIWTTAITLTPSSGWPPRIRLCSRAWQTQRPESWMLNVT